MSPSESMKPQLAALAQCHGHSQEECLAMLAAIDAPDDLVELRQIASNLVAIWPQLPTISYGDWSKDQMETWKQLCRWLSENPAVAALPKAPAGKKKLGPLSGQLTKFPLYCALWSPPPEGSRGQALQHLRGQLIHARDCWRHLAEQERKKYDAILLEASRLVRRLGEEKADPALLDHLPKMTCRAEEYRDEVKSLLEKGMFSSDPQPLKVLIRMVDYALGIRGGYGRRRQGGHQQGKTETLRSIVEFRDPEDDRQDPGWRQIEDVTLLQSEKQQAHYAGLPPEEIGDTVRLFQSPEPLAIHQGDSHQAQAIRERFRSRQIAVHNLNLPLRWDRLNLHDVLHLLRGLGNLLRRRLFRDWSTEQRTELAALVSVMYWTASPIERAVKTRFVDSWEKLPQQVSERNPLYLVWPPEGQPGWLLAAPMLPQRKLAKEDHHVYFRGGDDRILLPLHLYAARLIAPWMRLRFKPTKRSAALFTTDEATLTNCLKAFLSYVNHIRNTRLTAHRISIHLYQLLANECGDETEAMLITGRLPPAGQKAALYYYSPSKQRLAERYSWVCHRIIEAVLRALNPRRNQAKARRLRPATLPIKLQDHTGSRICLQEEAVRRMVADLQNAVTYQRKRKQRSAGGVIDFHNAYTTYCLWMLLFATGYRAVRDPFYHPQEIDWDTGFVVVCDKDGDDFFNSRLVWLPPLCLDQLKNYLQHRQIMAERLWVLNSQMPRTLADPQHPPLFFYLDQNGKQQAILPTALQQHSQWCYELPLNANRHYLRTRLRELAVSGEIVDAFMGHWKHGQEPFGRYSTLSPLSYRDQLQGPLERLLKEAGWKVIRGLP